MKSTVAEPKGWDIEPREDSKHLIKGRHYLLSNEVEVVYLGEELYETKTNTSKVKIVGDTTSLSPKLKEYCPELVNSTGQIRKVVPWSLKEIH